MDDKPLSPRTVYFLRKAREHVSNDIYQLSTYFSEGCWGIQRVLLQGSLGAINGHPMKEFFK